MPWVRTQQASRKYFTIQPPTDDYESIVKYIDTIRDAVATVERAMLKSEYILSNIALQNLTEKVRVPLAEKIYVHFLNVRFSILRPQ